MRKCGNWCSTLFSCVRVQVSKLPSEERERVRSIVLLQGSRASAMPVRYMGHQLLR